MDKPDTYRFQYRPRHKQKMYKWYTEGCEQFDKDTDDWLEHMIYMLGLNRPYYSKYQFIKSLAEERQRVAKIAATMAEKNTDHKTQLG